MGLSPCHCHRSVQVTYLRFSSPDVTVGGIPGSGQWSVSPGSSQRSVCPPANLSARLSVCPSVILSVSQSADAPYIPSIAECGQSVCLSAIPPHCLVRSVRQSVRLSVRPSVRPSVWQQPVLADAPPADSLNGCSWSVTTFPPLSPVT